jgi:Fe2+ or Zn2+ uptake regulation protein
LDFLVRLSLGAITSLEITRRLCFFLSLRVDSLLIIYLILLPFKKEPPRVGSSTLYNLLKTLLELKLLELKSKRSPL